MVSVTGITGPVDLAQCQFIANGVTKKADFHVVVTEASDININPIVPLPSIVISTIACVPVTTTTTLEGGGTTTTLEGGGGTTTTTEGGGGTTTTTIGGTTTTTLPIIPGAYDIVFQLDSSSEPANALQFSVSYTNAPGEFTGSAGDVVCAGNVDNAFFAPNDIDAQRKLTLGIITTDGIVPPHDLVTCRFVATNVDDLVVASQFVVTIQDATDADGNPVTAVISPVVKPGH
jgi:hypothetical protein